MQMLSIVTWLVYLFVYSQAVQTPLDLHERTRLSPYEWVLYIMTFSFLVDGELPNVAMVFSPKNLIP